MRVVPPTLLTPLFPLFQKPFLTKSGFKPSSRLRITLKWHNIKYGKMLQGGGKTSSAKYYVRKTGKNSYSLTITDKKNQILSIDTWSKGGAPMSKADIMKGLKNSGVTPPKGFWKSVK